MDVVIFFSFHILISFALCLSHSLWTFAQSCLVRTGGEAFYGFVLMRVDLPRCVTVDLTVDGQVPVSRDIDAISCVEGIFILNYLK